MVKLFVVCSSIPTFMFTMIVLNVNRHANLGPFTPFSLNFTPIFFCRIFYSFSIMCDTAALCHSTQKNRQNISGNVQKIVGGKEDVEISISRQEITSFKMLTTLRMGNMFTTTTKPHQVNQKLYFKLKHVFVLFFGLLFMIKMLFIHVLLLNEVFLLARKLIST